MQDVILMRPTYLLPTVNCIPSVWGETQVDFRGKFFLRKSIRNEAINPAPALSYVSYFFGDSWEDILILLKSFKCQESLLSAAFGMVLL